METGNGWFPAPLRGGGPTSGARPRRELGLVQVVKVAVAHGIFGGDARLRIEGQELLLKGRARSGSRGEVPVITGVAPLLTRTLSRSAPLSSTCGTAVLIGLIFHLGNSGLKSGSLATSGHVSSEGVPKSLTDPGGPIAARGRGGKA